MDNSAKITQYRELADRLERVAGDLDTSSGEVSNFESELRDILVIDDMVIEEENINESASEIEFISEDIRYNIIEMIEEKIAELSAGEDYE